MSLSPEDIDQVANNLFLLAERCERLAEAVTEISQDPDWPINLHDNLGQLSALLDDTLERADIVIR